MLKSAVRPFRLHRRDDDLACTVSRIVGYRATCECGWEGPSRGTYDAARREARRHLYEHDTAANGG